MMMVDYEILTCLVSFSRVVRKSIARVLTVINQTQKENLRKFYKVRMKHRSEDGSNNASKDVASGLR